MFIERPLKTCGFRCVDFTWNSQSSNKLLWNSPPPDFTQIGRQCETYERNFFQARKQKAFTATIFTKIPSAQQHCVRYLRI